MKVHNVVRFQKYFSSLSTGGVMIESKIQTIIHRTHLFCPICADNIYQHIENNTAPCPHVMYVYLDEASDFVHTHNDIKNIVQEVLTDLRSDDEPMMTLFELLSSIEGTTTPRALFQSMKESQAHPVSLLAQRLNSKSILHLCIETCDTTVDGVRKSIHMGYNFDNH